MGTRSVTHIHNYEEFGGNVICSFYRHMDGYPSGHGVDLAQWLRGKNIVNGINANFVEGVDYNGAGSLAVDLMYSLKSHSSIQVIETEGSDVGEDYIYHIRFINKGFMIEFSDYSEYRDADIDFNLTPEEMISKYA